MAAYADIDFAISVYGEEYCTVAFDRDGDGEIDTLAVETMFDIVTDEINSYLQGRVPLPLENVPRDLKLRAVDICIYRMCPDAARLTEEKTKRFEAATKWLQMVAKNEIKLSYGGESATGTHLTESARIRTQHEMQDDLDRGSRWFTRDKTKRIL